MINILWIEDEFSEQKKTEWFNHRNIDVKKNFLAAKDDFLPVLARHNYKSSFPEV
ncbi:MAG: hypothetical protein P1P78_02690 [Methyloprofundus sp.]|nr:hypothetical protein [Methyloprofundus sp.]